MSKPAARVVAGASIAAAVTACFTTGDAASAGRAVPRAVPAELSASFKLLRGPVDRVATTIVYK